MQDEPEPIPIELVGPEPAPWLPARPIAWEPEPRSLRSLFAAIGLFIITAFSTLAAGAQFAAAYAANQSPGIDSFFSDYFRPFFEPRLLISGIPFAVTLMGILLAHELGHFFACRHYHISATYPYFIPAPTLIGTLGAFIRIRSGSIRYGAGRSAGWFFDCGARAGVGYPLLESGYGDRCIFFIRVRPAPGRATAGTLASTWRLACPSFAASCRARRLGGALCDGT
jgi:hypothetical protein